MACTRSIPAMLGERVPSLGGHVGARSLAAALVLGASFVIVAASTSTAQELEWATSAGGVSDDFGIGIATDPRGNSYVTGGFRETAMFGAGEANETVLEAVAHVDREEAAFEDVFVAKYAPDGTLLWATSGGGLSEDYGFDIATDPRGNSYITGFFQGSTTFGEGEPKETVLRTAGLGLFVAKYAPDGTLLWATSAGGDGSDLGFGIAADPRGNSYMNGSFRQTATFGAGEANETVLEARAFGQAFVNAGTLLWTSTAGGGTAFGSGITTDPRGNSYVTGGLSGTVTFGAGEANETVLHSRGATAVFVARYARDGTLVWVTSVNISPTGAFGPIAAIATDPRGNSYVTGFFEGTATFGTSEPNETVLEAVASGDVFVAKYARDGTLVWARSAGGDGGESGLGIATDPQGNSYVTGLFGCASPDLLCPATFGTGEPNETVLHAVATEDVFVAKYARDGTLLWATSAGGGGSDLGFGIATDPRGNSYVTGGFRGTARFGAGEANETVLNSGAFGGVFVAKYARDGTLLWATNAGEEGFTIGIGIATDPRGNSYVTGNFGRTAIFGPGEANETVLESVELGPDVFVAKYGGSNDQDQCPDSDLSATVVIDGIDTGVENAPTNTEGCTVLDLIRQASDNAPDRAGFIRGVALLTRTLVRDELITAEEAGILRTAAAQARFPLS